MHVIYLKYETVCVHRNCVDSMSRDVIPSRDCMGMFGVAVMDNSVVCSAWPFCDAVC